MKIYTFDEDKLHSHNLKNLSLLKMTSPISGVKSSQA